MTEQTKACTKCGETKALEEFSPDKCRRDGRKSRCKACSAAWARDRYAGDAAFRKATHGRARRWRAQNPGAIRQRAQRIAESPFKHREAAHRYAVRLRAETRAAAVNHGKEWTGPELELAADETRTIRQVAKTLGRTYDAVAHARRLLRTDPRKIKVAGIPERDEP